MKNVSRIKRKVIKTQIADLGANPLTPRGKKYIRKEIERLRSKKTLKKLRYELEHQDFEYAKQQTYWEWMEAHAQTDEWGNLYEWPEANPDILMGDADIEIDENMSL